MKLVEYDLDTGIATESEVSDFIFPSESIIARIEDERIIYFFRHKEEKQFTPDDGRKNSSAFRKMMTWEGKKTVTGDGCLVNLFQNVQLVGNEIYIVCRVLNWHGETYALIYQYDFDSNTCRYVDYYFTGADYESVV